MADMKTDSSGLAVTCLYGDEGTKEAEHHGEWQILFRKIKQHWNKLSTVTALPALQHRFIRTGSLTQQIKHLCVCVGGGGSKDPQQLENSVAD